jgi:uncharacterized protein YodC (DUF2158 family)
MSEKEVVEEEGGNVESVEAIKPGDIVCLNSGGPWMTVGEPVAPGLHRCYWFDDTEQSHSDIFPLVALYVGSEDET